jgi:hypothetical protein
LRFVDRHHRRRPGEAGAHEHREADASHADDDNRRAGRHLRGVHDRADPRADAAAYEARDLGWNALVDRNGGLFRHHRPLCEGAHGQIRAHVGAVSSVEPRGSVGLQVLGGPGARAQPLTPALALIAAKAGVVPAEHDPLAGRYRGHAVPDRLDDSGRLVPQHDGSCVGPVASGLVEIGVADPRSKDLDAHFSGSGRIDREVLHG